MTYSDRLLQSEVASDPILNGAPSSWRPWVLAARCLGLFPVLFLLLLLGCVSDPTPLKKKPVNLPLPSRYSIDELHLLTMPAALNLDQTSGPDAFAVKVYAGSLSYPKPVPIREGTLEILMFDGVLKSGETASVKPLKIWQYTVAELKAHAFNTSIGICYQFTPQWGTNAPQQDRITIVGRYFSPSNAQIVTVPSTVEMNVK